MSKENAIEMRFEQAMIEKEKAEAEAAKWRKKAISAQNRAKAYQKWLKERDQEITELGVNIGRLEASHNYLQEKSKQNNEEIHNLRFFLKKNGTEIGHFRSLASKERRKKTDLYKVLMNIGYIVDKMHIFNLRRSKKKVLDIAGNVFEDFESEEGQK